MDVVKLTDASFDKEVTKDGLVMVIKFSHDGTTASGKPNADARLSEAFSKLAADYTARSEGAKGAKGAEGGGFRLFEMDYKDSEVAKRYEIASSTVLFLQQAELVGVNQKDTIKAKLDRLLQGAATS